MSIPHALAPFISSHPHRRGTKSMCVFGFIAFRHQFVVYCTVYMDVLRSSDTRVAEVYVLNECEIHNIQWQTATALLLVLSAPLLYTTIIMF